MVILCRYRFSQRSSRYLHIFIPRYSLIWIMDYFLNYWKLRKFRGRNAEVATRFFLCKKQLLKVFAKFKEKNLYWRLFLNKFLWNISGKLLWKWLIPTQIFQLLCRDNCLHILHHSIDNEILKSYLRPYKHLQRSIFMKLIDGLQPLTTFAKRFHRRCLIVS